MEENGVMKASEPAVAYPMTTYADVMAYIHSINISREDKEKVAHRLTVELTGPYLSQAFDRLDHLSQLKDDWDGYGAKKISYHIMSSVICEMSCSYQTMKTGRIGLSLQSPMALWVCNPRGTLPR